MSEEIKNDDKDFEDAFDEFASSDEVDSGEQHGDNDENDDTGLDDSRVDDDTDVSVDDEESELERLRKEKEELEHYKKSNEGRVSALQQKINDLMEQRIAESQSQSDDDNSDDNDDDEWNLLKEEDEFLAEQLEKRLQKERELIRNEMMQEIESKLQPIEQDREQAYINAQIAALSEKEPEWEDIVQSEGFSQWIESQPAPVQSLVQSVNADDYLYLINSYKSMNGISNSENTNQSAPADEIKRKRQEKLQSNVAVKQRNTGRVSGPPDDFEGAFEYFAKQDAIKKSRGY